MVVPGASGVSTARDMARFYAALAAGGALDGARILQPETVDADARVEVDGEIDRTFDVPVRRGLGFELGGLADPRRHWPGATSTVRTFWHGGFGSSVCWGDADSGWRWPSSPTACGATKPAPSPAATSPTRCAH